MKSLIASLVLLATFSAQASELNTFVCKVSRRWSPTIPADAYALKITELEDITSRVSYGTEYDAVLKVRVELKQKINGRTTTRTFFATANSYDVSYKISAVRAEGFTFGTYLDEMDQSGMTLTDANGKKTTISLDCKYGR